jgi:hypothetical protein
MGSAIRHLPGDMNTVFPAASEGAAMVARLESPSQTRMILVLLNAGIGPLHPCRTSLRASLRFSTCESANLRVGEVGDRGSGAEIRRSVYVSSTYVGKREVGEAHASTESSEAKATISLRRQCLKVIVASPCLLLASASYEGRARRRTASSMLRRIMPLPG